MRRFPPTAANFINFNAQLNQTTGIDFVIFPDHLPKLHRMNYLKKFRNIQHFIFDIDGVLTNGDVYLTPEGNLLRSMSIRDGYAIRIAVDKGYQVSIISGGITPGAKQRLGTLGVRDIYLNEKNKVSAYQDLVDRYKMDPQSVIYMGDDLPDYEVMLKVGLPCCPKDAVDEIRDISAYVSPKKGGDGCVRDVIEKVLKLKGNWPGYPNLPFPGE